MSAYEQRIEPPDKAWQYLLFAAEPYETIAFKVFVGINLFVDYTALQLQLLNKEQSFSLYYAYMYLLTFVNGLFLFII